MGGGGTGHTSGWLCCKEEQKNWEVLGRDVVKGFVFLLKRIILGIIQ